MYFKQLTTTRFLAIRRLSYGERLVSVSCVSDASPFEWTFPLTYFDEINIHIASDIDLGFCRQLTTFAEESLWRFMKKLNSNRV